MSEEIQLLTSRVKKLENSIESMKYSLTEIMISISALTDGIDTLYNVSQVVSIRCKKFPAECQRGHGEF